METIVGMNNEKVGTLRKIYRKVLYSDLDKVYKAHFDLPQKSKNGKKFLDVGTGFGFGFIRGVRDGFDCFSLEFDKERVKKTAQKLRENGFNTTLVVGDAQNLPFKKDVFDLVGCSHVIEHVSQDKKSLQDIYSSLKKGGTLNLAVPNRYNLRTRMRTALKLKNPYTDKTHLREYSKEEVLQIVKETGFEVKSVKMQGFTPPVGLRAQMIIGHYLPTGQMLDKLGEILPAYSTEVSIVAEK